MVLGIIAVICFVAALVLLAYNVGYSDGWNAASEDRF